MKISPMTRAVKICGSQSELARRIGRTQALVSGWLSKHRHLSAEDAIKIERATEGQVTRAELRPDIFGDAAE